MSASATASTGDVKIRGVGVGGEDHGAGSVEDAVVEVGGELVKELTEVGLGELGGCGLCGSKVAEGDEDLVVYCATIIQEGADDGLYSFYTGVVEFGDSVDNKLLVALSDLGSTQDAATELTKTDLSQLLDYLST